MFVRYIKGLAGDCYHMWNITRSKIYESRDVVFLQRMFFEKSGGVFSSYLRSLL